MPKYAEAEPLHKRREVRASQLEAFEIVDGAVVSCVLDSTFDGVSVAEAWQAVAEFRSLLKPGLSLEFGRSLYANGEPGRLYLIDYAYQDIEKGITINEILIGVISPGIVHGFVVQASVSEDTALNIHFNDKLTIGLPTNQPLVYCAKRPSMELARLGSSETSSQIKGASKNWLPFRAVRVT